MTTSQMGEHVVREQIADLDERIKSLQTARSMGLLGPRVVRARIRFMHAEYDRLLIVARNYGYPV
jgi:hypothetical protein